MNIISSSTFTPKEEYILQNQTTQLQQNDFLHEMLKKDPDIVTAFDLNEFLYKKIN